MIEQYPLFDREQKIVCGESAMFAFCDEVNLLFPATEILRVYNLISGENYEPGRDYCHTPNSATLQRCANSRIPRLEREELYLTAENAKLFPDPDANAIGETLSGGLLRFSEKGFFTRNQISIDYRTNAPFPELPSAPEALKRSRSAKELHLGFVGDSITAGCNSTKQLGIAPLQPAYPEILARSLNTENCKVFLRNFAVGGTGVQQCMENLPEWFHDFVPDLLVIAYGMNNFWMEDAVYCAEIKKIMDYTRKLNPDVEFILVASMPGNHEWKPTAAGPDEKFAMTLHQLAATTYGTAVADVYSFWTYVLIRKKYYDLTGNGVNHANDFGHRIYAEVLKALFR